MGAISVRSIIAVQFVAAMQERARFQTAEPNEGQFKTKLT
jgi:hypothetical protein